MNTHFSNWYERLRSSLWIVPAALTLASVVFSQFVLQVDDWITREQIHIPYLYPGGVEGSRQVLGALTGSMVSLTTISFSVMMVVLTLASNQFGPRVLRNFLADRFNQVALGVFVATFLYRLLVLGRVPEPGQDGHATPRLAVTVALALTTASLGFLIGFIHHVARSIQASHVVLQAHLEERRVIDALYPEDLGREREGASPRELPDDFERNAQTVVSRVAGYVQAVHGDDIVAFACTHDVLVRLCAKPGGFVTVGEPIAKISHYHDRGPIKVDLEKLTHGWIEIDSERTGEQDAQYGLRQLTEIAVRALSPGINDPTTALSCIDYIGDNLARLARRSIPSSQRLDEHETLRAILPRDGFVEIAAAACEALRHYGRGHPEVMQRLVAMLAGLAPRLRRPADRAWVRDALAGMENEADHLAARRDRMNFRHHCRQARDALRTTRAE